MKSLKALLSLLIILSINSEIFAEKVSVEKAKQVATNFMKQKHTYHTKDRKTLRMYKSLELTNISTRSFDNFYIFNLNDNQGWVIISGDDAFIPVLGYSKNGSFETDKLGPNTLELLKGYEEQIQHAADSRHHDSEEISKQWKELLSGESDEYISRSNRQVYPLIQTKWDQSPYYNYYCPYDATYDETTVTGCVATAMAQIMNYWEYPKKGEGIHSYNHERYGTLFANFGATYYDWDNMPNELGYFSSKKEKEAIAMLMFHCGVSVNMDYNVAQLGGSSAYIATNYSNNQKHCSEYAFKTYFDYKNTLQGIGIVDYVEDHSEEDWINLLKNELDNDRPILYAGFGDGGHAFVCDGYDNNDYFHYNWGWGGIADGYFSIYSLTPQGGPEGANYTYRQQIVIGIEPNNTSEHNFKLELYSDIDIEEEIWFGDEIELNVDIANYGNSTFDGHICAAVFDEYGNFVDYLEEKQVKIQSGYYLQTKFYNEGNMAFVPGIYQVMAFYRLPNGDWILIDDGKYTNYNIFEIYYSSDIEVYSDFKILSNNKELVNGKDATINVDIINTNKNTFYGEVRAELSNIDGTFVQTIQSYKIELQHNYHYTDGLTFSGTITAEPGTYHLSLAYKATNSDYWYYAGASDYPNPITVIVKAQPLSQDKYENNDTHNTAYKLNAKWNNNTSVIETIDANLHTGNDIDYYKITLPEGYNYEIEATLLDEFSSNENYSVDASVYYSIDSENYSEPFDDVVEDELIIHNGGTIYFAVTPYFQGMTGTYKLEIEIDRISTEDISEQTSSFSIYPNPANDIITIATEENIEEICIYTISGVMIYNDSNFTGKSIDVSDFNSGIYFVKIKTQNNVIDRRFIKN